MPLLNQRWSVHDVSDVEALLARALTRSRYANELRADERDDLVTYLFEFAWKLSQKFDPGRGSFATFLFSCSGRAIADYHRSRYRTKWVFRDRVYERPRPELVSLDDLIDRDLLGGSLGTGPGAPADGWSPDLGRLLGARDSSRARDANTLGLGGADRAAG